MTIWIVSEKLPNGKSIALAFTDAEQARKQLEYCMVNPASVRETGEWNRVDDGTDGSLQTWSRCGRVVEMRDVDVYQHWQRV